LRKSEGNRPASSLKQKQVKEEENRRPGVGDGCLRSRGGKGLWARRISKNIPYLSSGKQRKTFESTSKKKGKGFEECEEEKKDLSLGEEKNVQGK